MNQHVGHLLANTAFVVCRETKEVFLYAVTDQTATTLLGTILACIAPGSVIIYSRWVSCQGFETMIGMKYIH